MAEIFFSNNDIGSTLYLLIVMVIIASIETIIFITNKVILSSIVYRNLESRFVYYNKSKD